MSWLFWTLIAIVSIVFYYFFSKKMFNDNDKIDPRFYGGMLQTVVGLIALVPTLLTGWKFEFNVYTISWLIVVAVAYTIGPSLYYTGLKHTQLSVTTTLDATGAIYAMILGIIVLNESFTITKILGAGLILFAIMLVAGKTKAIKHFNKYEILLLIAPLFYAIGGLADNILIDYSNALTYLTLSFLVAGVTMILVNVPRLKEVGLENLSERNFLRILVLNAVFVAIYGYASYRAYIDGGELSAMYPIMQSESVVVPFMAMWLLGEKDRFLHKILGAVLAFLGILVMSNPGIIPGM